jgi:hypothetical protein
VRQVDPDAARRSQPAGVHAHADRYQNGDRYQHAHQYADNPNANAHQHADTPNPHADQHADGHPHRDTHEYADRHTYSHTHRHADQHADGYPDRDTDEYADGYSHRDTHEHANHPRGRGARGTARREHREQWSAGTQRRFGDRPYAIRRHITRRANSAGRDFDRRPARVWKSLLASTYVEPPTSTTAGRRHSAAT